MSDQIILIPLVLAVLFLTSNRKLKILAANFYSLSIALILLMSGIEYGLVIILLVVNILSLHFLKINTKNNFNRTKSVMIIPYKWSAIFMFLLFGFFLSLVTYNATSSFDLDKLNNLYELKFENYSFEANILLLVFTVVYGVIYKRIDK